MESVARLVAGVARQWHNQKAGTGLLLDHSRMLLANRADGFVGGGCPCDGSAAKMPNSAYGDFKNDKTDLQSGQ